MVPDLDALLDDVVRAAAEPASTSTSTSTRPAIRRRMSLDRIADAVLRNGFDGRVARRPLLLARRAGRTTRRGSTLDKVAEAGIVDRLACRCATCTCRTAAPTARTPRWRGVTLLHEMKARGIPVAIASDNTRDPFYAYGDLDMLEVFREATRILHLDHPIGDWPSGGRRDAGRDHRPAPSYGVHRAGRAGRLRPLPRPHLDRAPVPSAIRPHRAARRHARSTRTLPDYRELDD